jgi:hypothetical protein
MSEIRFEPIRLHPYLSPKSVNLNSTLSLLLIIVSNTVEPDQSEVHSCSMMDNMTIFSQISFT